MKKPIIITQQGSGWVARKGKTTLALNLATWKVRWSPESRITIDDQIWYENLLHVQESLAALGYGK